jgi:hypothetical protein
MPIAWFICPYKRREGWPGLVPARYCAMDDFTPQIIVDKGAWAESEVLGDRAVVKVRASDATLAVIEAEPGFARLPKSGLSESLSDRTPGEKQALADLLVAGGYSAKEVREGLGANLGGRTLGDILRFAAQRRLKPRYDAAKDAIVLDGPVQWVRPIDEIDKVVI